MSFDEIIETVGEELADEENTEESEPVDQNEEIEEAEENEVVEETPENETEDEPENEETKPDASELAYLKAELETLKKELAESRAFYSRLEGECAEFSELYPGVPLASLPDSIWQSVKKGVPLAAAYALEVRKAELDTLRAQKINTLNRNMSSGALEGDSRSDYFTPDQVRAMSAAEVRANYTKIVNSMSKWH